MRPKRYGWRRVAVMDFRFRLFEGGLKGDLSVGWVFRAGLVNQMVIRPSILRPTRRSEV